MLVWIWISWFLLFIIHGLLGGQKVIIFSYAVNKALASWWLALKAIKAFQVWTQFDLNIALPGPLLYPYVQSIVES